LKHFPPKDYDTCNQQIKKTRHQNTKEIMYLSFSFSHIMHLNYFACFNTTQCQSSLRKLKLAMKFSFFETIPQVHYQKIPEMI